MSVNQIKLALLVKGVRQIDIARHVGVSKSYISSIISGKEKPSEKVLKAFHDIAGIDLKEFI